MGGIPRNSFHSTLTAYALLIRYFPPVFALVINEFLMRIAAFVGMFLLLRHKLFPKTSGILAVGTAFAFALLPFWPPGCLSVAGLPLLFYAALQLRDGETRRYAFLIVALFPFFSVLVMIGWVVVLAALFLIALSALKRDFPGVLRLAIAVTLLIVIYAAVEYRFLYQHLFDAGYVSHRTEMGKEWFGKLRFTPDQLSTVALTRYAISNDLLYAPVVQKPLLIGFFAIGIVSGVVGYFRQRDRQTKGEDPGGDSIGNLNDTGERRNWRIFYSSVSVIALATATFVFQHHPVLSSWSMEHLPGPFRTLNVRRIGWIAPVAWYVGLAALLAIIWNKNRAFKTLALSVLVIQIGFVAADDTRAQGAGGQFTIDEMYSTSLYEKIGAYIGRDQADYRVASVGLLPAIAQFNGFHTVDGYMADYPLSYKRRFWDVIAPSLELDPFSRAVFIIWGSKCYIPIAEFPGSSQLVMNNVFMLPAGSEFKPESIQNLKINAEALNDLGCEYVFSAYKILNADELGFTLHKHFAEQGSPWEVYLYTTSTGKLPGGATAAIGQQ